MQHLFTKLAAKCSGLKFAFCVSLLIHGTIFSVVSYVKHRQSGAARPFAPEPSSAMEIVMDSDRPAASVSVAPVVVMPKPQVPASEPAPVKPAVMPPPEPPKPEEKPETVPTVLNQPAKSAEKTDTVADGKPVVAMPVTDVSSVSSMPVVGESQRDSPGYLVNPKPVYPPEARRRNEQGLVVLDVLITGEGTPQSVTVARSSGHAMLDKAAVEAVRQWRFSPARIGNLPMASRVEVPVRFKLLD